MKQKSLMSIYNYSFHLFSTENQKQMKRRAARDVRVSILKDLGFQINQIQNQFIDVMGCHWGEFFA